MSLDEFVDVPGGDVDVVVIGFGIWGASAAIEAARSGARVLVLDRRRAGARRRSSRRARALQHRLQADALAAGVQLWTGTTVHELLVEDARVVGVGYEMETDRARARQSHRWSERLPGWRRAPSNVIDADATSSVVGSVTCCSVVLAMDESRWEFVGTGVWAVESAGHAKRSPLPVVGVSTRRISPLAPELNVREWCAKQQPCGNDGMHRAELCVEETGAVATTAGVRVPGLYCALPSRTDRVAVATGASQDLNASRCAGQSAAEYLTQGSGSQLKLVV